MAEGGGQVQTARITVTVNRPEWGGPAQLRCHQWRLAGAAAELGAPRQVVYIPGLMADFTPDAPVVLLRAAAARGIPVVATVIDLPEYGSARLPPGWAGRLARSRSLEADARLLAAVLAQVIPGEYTVVGGSVGANLATLIAALAPDRVAGIQLCMPAGFCAQPVLRGLVAGVALTLLLELRRPVYRQMMLRSQTFQAAPAMLGSLGKLPALLQVIRILGQANALPYARRVRCPVVFALGRHDIIFAQLIPMSARGELAALFPAAPAVTVHVLEGADHNGFASHSAELAALTVDLLSGGTS
jgi:pimeloyl-ACP methyl ester carboxylesterase